jgi:Domain of unknown function (DUF5666)
MSYQDALERALSLTRNPGALEAYLQTVPSWRSDIERAIAVSRSVSRDLVAVQPRNAATQRSRQQLMSVVSRLASDQANVSPSRRSGLLAIFALHRFAIAGVAAAAMLLLVLAVNLPSLSGGGTPTAEALVIEGNLAEVSANAMTVSINNAPQTVKLSSDTVLQDSFGNTVATSKLSAGQDVVLQGSRSGDDFLATQVQLKDWLFGVVTALPGNGIHLSSDSGDYVIQVTADTQFEGPINVGDNIQVRLTRMSDGSLVALEVESENDDGEGDQQGDDGDHESSGLPPGSPVAAATPSSSSEQEGGSGGTSEQSQEDPAVKQQSTEDSSRGDSSQEDSGSSYSSEHEDH